MADPVTRREFLQQFGTGMGAVAFASMIGAPAPAAGSVLAGPLVPKKPHFAPKAKRVLHLFQTGGPSHVDTFDPKPELRKFEGKRLPKEFLQGLEGKMNSERVAFPSPFKFPKCGQSGLEISEIFPHLSSRADDLCVIRSMQTDAPDHGTATWVLHHGNGVSIRPALGAWITYGLGSENQNLPGFVAMCPQGVVSGEQAWQSDFLPAACGGTFVDPKTTDMDRLIANLRNNHTSLKTQRRQLDLLERLNRNHEERLRKDAQLDARIQSFELAYRMQMEAVDAFDISKEPKHIQDLYGIGAPNPTGYSGEGLQAQQMLMARRLLERGVRFVQVWHNRWGHWDSHEDNNAEIVKQAKYSDRATAALLTDLKQRGLLEDTLIIWGGEFGRSPTAQVLNPKAVMGRDHHARGFSTWLAGGGVKGGFVYGATDPFGFTSIEKPVHVHDLHATILHLLGFDHERLTYRYAGRDFRLTDVHGNVVKEVLA